MWFIDKVKGVIQRMFATEAEKAFDVTPNTIMDINIAKFDRISRGNPDWIKDYDDVKATGFAGYINEHMAKLVTLNLSIECPEGELGEYLQKQADYVLKTLQNNVSRALGGCGIMFKPNGETIDYVFPDSFAPVDYDSNGTITGAIFQSNITKGKKYYTRLEYHRFEGEQYRISNACYVSEREGVIGRRCSLGEVQEWADLQEEVSIKGLEKPLFSFFKNPAANMLEDSPLGVPIWVNCLKELEDYDVAWSRKSDEVRDSTHVTFLPQSAISFAKQNKIKLPRFVRGIQTSLNQPEEIRDHVAPMLTEQRIADLSATLAAISTKCGLSQSAFVYNEKTGLATATQIEAEEQETIRTVDRIRDALKASLIQLFEAILAMAYLYDENLRAEDIIDEINFSFDDITANFEEDKQSWWKYVQGGYAPAWKYFVMFEGMSEEDARAMVQEAKMDQQQDSLAGMFEGRF